jgi:hypothetical protein
MIKEKGMKRQELNEYYPQVSSAEAEVVFSSLLLNYFSLPLAKLNNDDKNSIS